VTKANKDDVTNIKLQRSKNKCPSVYKVYLVVQLGLDVKDDLKYNKVNKEPLVYLAVFSLALARKMRHGFFQGRTFVHITLCGFFFSVN
jgi:hypothetical protein